MGPNNVSVSEGSVADGIEEGAFGCQYLTLSLAIEPVICHLSDMLHLYLECSSHGDGSRSHTIRHSQLQALQSS